MRTLSNGKGQTLETPLTDEQAAACCRRLSANKFAQELAGKWDDYQRHRRPWPLSEAQLFWLHKLALEGDSPKTHSDDVDCAPIVRLFQKVRGHVQFPRIRLVLPADPAQPDGPRQPLALTWASGTTAKHPNTINVTDGGPFGRNVWYGRIGPDGAFYRSRHCSAAVIGLLKRFAADPAGTAREHGKLNGKCCFCGQELSDPRSVAVGYGQTCALSYNLPWGDKRADVSTVIEPQPVFDSAALEREYHRLIQEGDRDDSRRAAEAKYQRDKFYGIGAD